MKNLLNLKNYIYCFFLAIFGISKIRNFSEILYLYLMIIQYTIKLKVISIKKLVRDTLKN